MLTDARCRTATCPEGKARFRLTDANGLYLEVSPAGSKRWFWKTYAEGKEGRMALGMQTMKAGRYTPLCGEGLLETQVARSRLHCKLHTSH